MRAIQKVIADCSLWWGGVRVASPLLYRRTHKVSQRQTVCLLIFCVLGKMTAAKTKAHKCEACCVAVFNF